jgi:hypothetical protein
MVNVGLPDGSPGLERVLAATIRAAGFRTLLRDPVEPQNTLLVASDAAPSDLRSSVPQLPAALRPLASAIARRLGPALIGGAVYTDDRAPVEWLIDSTIVQLRGRPRLSSDETVRFRRQTAAQPRPPLTAGAAAGIAVDEPWRIRSWISGSRPHRLPASSRCGRRSDGSWDRRAVCAARVWRASARW